LEVAGWAWDGAGKARAVTPTPAAERKSRRV